MDDAVRDFLAGNRVGVIGTTRPDGSPRLTTVYYVVDGDSLFVSTEASRAKARDITRTGRATMCVHGTEPPYPSVTVDGPATLVTEGAGTLSTQIMEAVTGKPAEQPLTDEMVASVGRVIVEIAVDRTSGRSWF